MNSQSSRDCPVVAESGEVSIKELASGDIEKSFPGSIVLLARNAIDVERSHSHLDLLARHADNALDD